MGLVRKIAEFKVRRKAVCTPKIDMDKVRYHLDVLARSEEAGGGKGDGITHERYQRVQGVEEMD